MKPQPSVLDYDFGANPRETAEMAKMIKIMLLNHDHPNIKAHWPPWLTSPEGLGESADGLETAIDRAEQDRAMLREMDERHRDVKRLMLKIGQYIELAVDGDSNAVRRAGFKVRAPHHKKNAAGPPPAPELTVHHGVQSGTFAAKITRYAGAKSYRVQITDQDPSTNPAWSDVDDFPLASKILIPGREPGKLYWLRASILSSAGRGPWCLPVSIRSL